MMGTDFLDFHLSTPFGVPACAKMLSEGIKLAAAMGFSVFTYKTIRCREHKGHPEPNVFLLSPTSMTNSYGNNSRGPKETVADIALAKSYVSSGQVLIVSVYGESIEDFVEAACMAKDAGAHCVELNLSCPNVKQEPLCYDLEWTLEVCSKVVQALGSTPVLVKLPCIDDTIFLSKLLVTITKISVQGVCGINSLPRKILTPEGNPVFGWKREVSGVSGELIFPYAVSFLQKVRKICDEKKLPLSLLATGGAVRREQLEKFLDLGADVAMTATGFMLDPQILRKKDEPDLRTISATGSN